MDESYLEWLTVLPGFSAEKARKVAERFPTFEHLRAATPEELASVEGLSPHDLEALHRLARDPRGRDANGHLFLCPECGSFAGPASTECPFCGVSFEEAESVAEIDAFLHDEEAPALLCQACGAVMPRDATDCPVCRRTYTPREVALLPGVLPETESPDRLCPRCGAYLGPEVSECVICGFDHTKVPEAPVNGHNGHGLAEGFLSRWRKVSEAAPTTELERVKEELEQFDRILEADASLEKVWAKRGRALAKLGRAVEAAESLEKAAELDPRKDEAYRLEVLDILGAKGDMSFLPPRWQQPRATAAPAPVDPRLVDALRHYDALLDEDPELVVAWRTKGEILERLGRVDEARACVERAEALERHEDDLLKARVAGLQAPGIGPTTMARSGHMNGRVNGRTNGRTNGRVNGLSEGRVNGLTNGAVNGVGAPHGATNGLGGFTNGRTNGLVNGNGFTNGRGGRYGPSRLPQQPHWARSLVGIAAVIALMVLVPVLASIFSPGPGSYAPIAIDHNFSDWNLYTAYLNAPPANLNNPDINLLEVKVATDPSNLFVYAKVQGLFFQAPWTNGTESLLVFVDTDHNANTGYPVGDLGADLLTVVTGWDGQIQSTGRYVFNETGSARSNDFRRFLPAGTVDAAFQGNEAELRIPMDTNPSVARALVYTADNQGNRDSMVGMIQAARPTVVLSQQTVAAGTVRTASTPFLRISLSAMGGVPIVDGLTFLRQGSSTDPVNIALYQDDGSGTYAANDTILAAAPLRGPLTPVAFNLTLSRPTTLWAVVSWSSLTANSTFGVQVVSAAGNGTASLTPPETSLVYLGSAPATPTVDGAFGDWAGRSYGADPLMDVVNPASSNVYDANIDLTSVAVDRAANLTGFAEVGGRMLGGEDIPNEVQRPSPPPNGTISNVTPPYVPQVGYDVLYGYLDADNSSLTGLRAATNGRTFGFDYALAVTGRNGTIVSSALYIYAPGANTTWRLVRPIVAALDAHRIEFGVDAAAMNLTSSYKVVFYATDWRLEYDVALPDAAVQFFALGAQAISGNVVLNEVSPQPNPEWIEVANPTSAAVDLAGWNLVIMKGNKLATVYTFGNVILGAWGSGTEYAAVQLPKNSLPNGVTTLGLTLTQNGVPIDSTTVPQGIGGGTTWARLKDPSSGQPMSSYNGGSAWYTSTAPSPGRPNDRTRPILSVAKTASAALGTPGDLLTYTIYFNNTGDGVAKIVWINDTMPSGVTYVSSSLTPSSVSGSSVSWVLSNIAPGTHSLTVTAEVNGNGADGSLQVNWVTLSYTDQLRRILGSGQAWANLTVTRPQITIVKTVSPVAATAGQTVTYTIYYNNTGSSNAGTVNIVDSLPSGLTYTGSNPAPTAVSGRTYYWNFTNVVSGSHSITLTATVDAGTPTGDLVNWAYLNYTSIRGFSLSGSSSSAIVAIPELSDFLFVAAVPFLVIGLRRRARRSKEEKEE